MPDFQIEVTTDVTLKRTMTVNAPTEEVARRFAEVSGGNVTDLSKWSIYEPEFVDAFKVQTTEVVG